MHEETGLSTSTKTPGVIATAEEYRAAVQRWQAANYNVLTPFSNVTGIAPSFGIIASVVKLNADPASGEVYGGLPFLKGQKGTASEELAPAKVGLRKLAECAGISTDAVRTDPRTIPNYWEFHATASYRGLDGSMTTRAATFEWDLRDGSDRLKGWTPNQITEGRKSGLRNCEARAINAAIRECGCGIKQKYTRAELDRPFLVVRVAFQPDMHDPAIKEMVTRQALGGVNAMYPAAHALPPHEDHAAAEPAEPRSVGRGSTSPTAAMSTAPAKPAAPAADVPPVDGAVRIAKVEAVNGETKGRKWTKYTVVDSNGVAYSTFDKQHFDDAERFKAANEWVEIVCEVNGQYSNIVEIIKAGSEPQLPGLDEV